MNSAAPRSCIVIGAGLAGLAAARFLALQGWSITVLEAGAKLGGRVVSYRFKEAPSLVCELGGEWIGRDHTRMIELCKELRLETMSHRYGFRFWRTGSGVSRRAYPPGAWPFSRHAKKKFKAFGRALNLYSDAEKIQLDARIVKTAILCPTRFWPQTRRYGFSVFTDRVSDFCFDATFGQEGEEGILCSYAIGDKADDVASERRDDIAKWVIEDVGKACLIPKPPRHRDVKRCSWQRDTSTGGSYAIYRPGQWFTVRSILKRPHHRVFFAGEHLADWQGFMEGAVRSGEATAATVLRQS
jgi:monoamine oxidase